MIENGQIRTFIAIEFPDEFKERLKAFQYPLRKPDNSFVRWVDPQLMHLTLKFMGDQHRQKIEIIGNALKQVASENASFSLSTGQPGCFPGWNNMRIYWLGLEGDIKELQVLQYSVEEYLSRSGFARESRPFKAHLTLARIREGCSRQNVAAFTSRIRDIKFGPSFSFRIDRISLMKSTLTRSGPVYELMSEYKLHCK